ARCSSGVLNRLGGPTCLEAGARKLARLRCACVVVLRPKVPSAYSEILSPQLVSMEWLHATAHRRRNSNEEFRNRSSLRHCSRRLRKARPGGGAAFAFADPATISVFRCGHAPCLCR